MWTDHPKFEGIVQEDWNAQVAGTLQFQIATKLWAIKAGFKSLNINCFLDIPAKSLAAKDVLLNIQRLIARTQLMRHYWSRSKWHYRVISC